MHRWNGNIVLLEQHLHIEDTGVQDSVSAPGIQPRVVKQLML